MAIFVSDFQLGKHAKGYQFFNKKLPFGFELKKDDDDQYKIVEEGFINIISRNQEITLENGEIINIQKLLKYTTKNNVLFVYVKTDKGNRVIEILIDKKRARGTQLVFSDIKDYNYNIDWINLEKNLLLLTILHFLFQVLFLVLISGIILKLMKR